MAIAHSCHQRAPTAIKEGEAKGMKVPLLLAIALTPQVGSIVYHPPQTTTFSVVIG